MENLPIGSAAYRVIEDIENYNRLGDLKKQYCDTGMQINIRNQISGAKMMQ
jgi:hypothetical protein